MRVEGNWANLFSVLLVLYIGWILSLIVLCMNWKADNKFAAPIYAFISTALGLFMFFQIVLVVFWVLDFTVYNTVDDGEEKPVENNAFFMKFCIYFALVGFVIIIFF